MELAKARRIVRLVDVMHVTWDELKDLYPTNAPRLLYHEAWCVCMKADINELSARIKAMKE